MDVRKANEPPSVSHGAARAEEGNTPTFTASGENAARLRNNPKAYDTYQASELKEALLRAAGVPAQATRSGNALTIAVGHEDASQALSAMQQGGPEQGRSVLHAARYLYSTPDLTGDVSQFRIDHYYTPVDLNGKPVDVLITLRQPKDAPVGGDTFDGGDGERYNGRDFHGDGNGDAGSTVKNLKPQNLMDELANSGVKYSVDDVVTVAKTPDGKLIWLEKGNASSGLQHITDGHATDFANRGINDIPGFLNRTLQETPIRTGVNKVGPFADYLIDGKMYKVAYGTNGYVVSFFPID